MGGSPRDELATKLVDLTHVPLTELFTLSDPKLLDAMHSVAERIPLSNRDQIQEPGKPRLELSILD